MAWAKLLSRRVSNCVVGGRESHWGMLARVDAKSVRNCSLYGAGASWVNVRTLCNDGYAKMFSEKLLKLCDLGC
jgi:hypothetical protein